MRLARQTIDPDRTSARQAFRPCMRLFPQRTVEAMTGQLGPAVESFQFSTTTTVLAAWCALSWPSHGLVWEGLGVPGSARRAPKSPY